MPASEVTASRSALRILESLVVRVSVVPEISVDRQCAASNTATGGVLDEVVEDLQESGWIVVDGEVAAAAEDVEAGSRASRHARDGCD